MSVKRICEAVVRNEKSILPISTMMTGEYGITDVVLSFPCIVGSDGCETKIPITLNQEESQALLLLRFDRSRILRPQLHRSILSEKREGNRKNQFRIPF